MKKAYVELNQVLNMAMNDYGEPSTWNYQKSNEIVPWVQTYIEPYVKVVKSGTCPGANQQCLGMNPLQALGYDPKSNSANASVPTYMIVKTGPDMAWGFWRHGGVYESATRIRVWVSNPPKIQFWRYKYSYVGKDVFTFYISSSPTSKPSARPYLLLDNKGETNKREVILGKTNGGCNPKAAGGGYWTPGDACSALILLDDWKISDNYPWRRN